MLIEETTDSGLVEALDIATTLAHPTHEMRDRQDIPLNGCCCVTAKLQIVHIRIDGVRKITVEKPVLGVGCR